MKKIFVSLSVFAFCFFCATAAFGQAGYISSNVTPAVIPDNPLHAEQHPMRSESSLLGEGAYSYAHGERPLSDFGSTESETPLGDIARAFKKQKEEAKAKKAVKVMESQ